MDQSPFNAPQLPFMPFGGGPGSITGSDHGQMPMMTGMGYQNTGSVYGMMPPMMSGMNMYGGSFNGSQGGFAPPVMPAASGIPRPMSTLSMATTANMFSGPSQNPNPSDDELFSALRNYLSTQDLMTVTKKYVLVISSRPTSDWIFLEPHARPLWRDSRMRILHLERSS
jgi:chitin synthase